MIYRLIDAGTQIDALIAGTALGIIRVCIVAAGMLARAKVAIVLATIAAALVVTFG